jgi:hypothetical protein
MSGDRKDLSCQEFQARLADLVGAGGNVSLHPHVQNCETCRALLADLETIAEAARQLMPIEQPKEDLWDRIEMAIKKEEGATQPD